MDSASISMRLKRVRAHVRELQLSQLLILLWLGSFSIHLIVVLIFIYQPIALDDMFQYDMLARSLSEGNGFRWYSQADVEILRSYYSQFLDIDRLPFPEEGLLTTFRAPGYPFFLAVLYLLAPGASRFALARLAQAGVMALLAPLAALLAHQAGLSKRAAALAGLGISLYPILLFYPIGLASENLYIVLGMASLVAVLYCAEKRALGWTLLAGLLCGATMFTRSIFAIFVVLAGLWISHSSPRRIKAGLLFGLAAFGFCLPWSIRNSILMHRPAFVENSLGYNLFIGYHPQGDGGFVSKIAILPMNILDDGERERLCMQQAIQFIRQDPLEAARRIFTRLVKYLGPEDQEFFYFYSNDLVGAIPQPWLALLYLLLVIPWGCTLIFGTAGLWLLKDRRIVLPVALFLIGYGLPHLFIIADPRFHLAWIPVLAPFVAYGWEGRREIPWKRFLRKEDMVLATLLSLILFVLLFGLAANLPRLVAIMNQGGNQLYWSY